MIPVNSKCPKCEEGIMKLPANPTELSPVVALPAECDARSVAMKIMRKLSPKGDLSMKSPTAHPSINKEVAGKLSETLSLTPDELGGLELRFDLNVVPEIL